MRKALRISPGSKVIFKLDDGRLILEKPELDAVAIFRRTAKQINHNTRVNTHLYEEELEERNP
jgi:bifunctional DNA-binding transcriptional regulator/antitoxin component of YhaV-PrlF toxin-antitoxin module